MYSAEQKRILPTNTAGYWVETKMEGWYALAQKNHLCIGLRIGCREGKDDNQLCLPEYGIIALNYEYFKVPMRLEDKEEKLCAT